jgi:hypothetical protein
MTDSDLYLLATMLKTLSQEEVCKLEAMVETMTGVFVN